MASGRRKLEYYCLCFAVIATCSLMVYAEELIDYGLCNCTGVPIKRASFPPGFVFGAATSNYQIEGAFDADGKGLSNWDYFTNNFPERIEDHFHGRTGNLAIDSYNRYQEDVLMARLIGLDSYRFSISWSRVIPSGKRSKGVNQAGIDYYNRIIDELIAHGMEPNVFLFHWDTPQDLEKEYGGFLSEKIVDDFRDYAEVMFEAFGDRVKTWITLNEPYSYSNFGYARGNLAPGRCSTCAMPGTNCLGGDSGTEPYIVSHNLILAHAAAVELYRKKFQKKQGGEIGITLASRMYQPYDNSSKADVAAKRRSLDFFLGWFLDPITFGDYPKSMRKLVRERLPRFSKQQKKLITKSFDFIGLNYYTTNYVLHNHLVDPNCPSYTTDNHVNVTSVNVHNVTIGTVPGAAWLRVYPRGLRDLLVYMKENYNDPPILITENGACEEYSEQKPLFEALNDTHRIHYIREHFCCLYRAINDDKVKMKGYFAWSLFDNFEWSQGYNVRFGLGYVDYKNNLARYPKMSALWLKSVLVRGASDKSTVEETNLEAGSASI